jgi:succinate dehydrogenase / fumarate reductase cytochrome b subunit
VIEKDNRPVFLNLLAIKLPIVGVVSILHRISGFALFLCFPLVVWLLQVSLISLESFNQLQGYLVNSVLLKILVVLIAVGFIYHVLAGLKNMVNKSYCYQHNKYL